MSHRVVVEEPPPRRRAVAVPRSVTIPKRRPMPSRKPNNANARTVLVGTSAVCLVVAASRWGTYIGANPIYLTDLLLIGGAACAVIVRRRPAFDLYARRATPGPVYLLLLAYIIARLLVSLLQQPLLISLRDAFPYLYLGIGVLSAAAVSRSSSQTRRRTIVLLYWALVIHVLWAAPAAITRFYGVAVPFAGAPVLAYRPDIDAALFGVGAGVFILFIARGQYRLVSALALVISCVAVLFLSTRAGLLSFLVCLALATGFLYISNGARPTRRATMRIIVPLVLFAAVAVVGQTTVGDRVIATVLPGSASSAAELNAVGTQSARVDVWTGVVDWVVSDGRRTIVGSGFGDDFLEESGTRQLLEGTTYNNVRSPHNYFVGSFARLGIIGLALLLTVLVQAVCSAWRMRRIAATDPLVGFSCLMVAAILVVSSLGVVLEAPFGAVPFWWCAGLILAVGTPGFRTSGSPRPGRPESHTQPSKHPGPRATPASRSSETTRAASLS